VSLTPTTTANDAAGQQLGSAVAPSTSAVGRNGASRTHWTAVMGPMDETAADGYLWPGATAQGWLVRDNGRRVFAPGGGVFAFGGPKKTKAMQRLEVRRAYMGLLRGLVHSFIKVYWPLDDDWYTAKVLEVVEQDGCDESAVLEGEVPPHHRVIYTADVVQETLNLAEEVWKPTEPPDYFQRANKLYRAPTAPTAPGNRREHVATGVKRRKLLPADGELPTVRFRLVYPPGLSPSPDAARLLARPQAILPSAALAAHVPVQPAAQPPPLIIRLPSLSRPPDVAPIQSPSVSMRCLSSVLRVPT
jgi:hypothetical protein